MNRTAFVLVPVATVAGAGTLTAPISGQADEKAAPIFGAKIWPGYRDWKSIPVAHEAGNLDELGPFRETMER